jgi:hypothetical protein
MAFADQDAGSGRCHLIAGNKGHGVLGDAGERAPRNRHGSRLA